MATRKVKLDPETDAKLRQIAAMRSLSLEDVVGRILHVCLEKYEKAGSLAEPAMDDLLAGLKIHRRPIWVRKTRFYH